MERIAIVVWVYAAFVFVGGVMGWVKAKSRPSLVAGMLFGVALAVTGWQLSRPGALLVALGLSLVLLTVFGIRLAKTRKLMPAGVSALASLIVVIILTAVLVK